MNLFGMITTSASRAYTEVALRSFFLHTPAEAVHRFILIDNDGDYSFPADIPAERIAVVRPVTPQGFGRNANLLLAEARMQRADLFLLNNDLVFTPGWLAPLLADRPAVLSSISNAQVAYSNGSFSVKPSMDLQEYVGRERELAGIAEQNRSAHHGYQRVPSVAFFCVKIPHRVHEAVGEFDERFGTRGAEDLDYCLRSSLAGFTPEWALASYVLHFQGKSTWRGPESHEQHTARTNRCTDAFQRKWGGALTYAFVAGDWNLFLTDRTLAANIRAKQLKPVIEHLRAHPSLEPFIARQQQARFGAVCCIYGEDAWLAPTVESVYEACDSIWFLVSDRPWHGEATDQQALVDRIRALPDPSGKMRIVRGSWADEATQRNEGMKLLADAGIEYCLVLDADEIYDERALGAAMNLVRQNPHVDAWRMSCFTYWKSYRHRVDPPEAVLPVVFARVGLASFVDARNCVADRQARIPVEMAAIHHMSYARTDDQILRKITTFSHAADVVPGWYENVWLKWDGDRSIENLNPCWPGAYQRIIDQSYEALPPVLRRLWDQDTPSRSVVAAETMGRGTA